MIRRGSGGILPLLPSLLLSAIGLGLPASVAAGQTPPAKQTAPTAPATRQAPPWPVILGAKVMLCEQNRPVASRVVLVPDESTYLEQISKWSPAGQWPVLFEDDPGTPRFIRAFAPDEVVRVPATERVLPKETDARRKLATIVTKISFGATDPNVAYGEVYSKFGWRPPGFVVTSMDDSAWTAAVAISAARGVPLAFVDGDFGDPNGELSAGRLRDFEAELRAAATASGYSWEGLGDDLDAVAVCRDLAGRCRMSVPEPAKVRLQGRDPGSGPYATMDALCRNDDGRRWGYAGWIWGDAGHAAGMAMSSIFLDRRNIWLCSGYAKSGQWNVYEVSKPAARLAELGYASMFFEEDAAGLAGWFRLVRGAIPPDVLFLNSHGSPTVFHLFEDEQAFPQDVPFLTRPMALHMIHSFSLKRPADGLTVGGRFLRRGVYAYLGSVDEPYLGAFIPPALMVERLAAGVPFLLAGRYWPDGGPMSGVWKLTAIGDPFMQAVPPAMRRIRPLEDPPELMGAVDLLELAKVEMVATRDDPARGAEAIRLLTLLGRDEIARQVWEIIEKTGDRAAMADAAVEAMGPLFRARDWDDFFTAYAVIPRERRTNDARDMLWHLANPRLAGLSEPNVFATLSAEVRGPMPSVDLGRLMPHLDRVLGAGAGRAAVQRRMDSETKSNARRGLQKLLIRG